MKKVAIGSFVDEEKGYKKYSKTMFPFIFFNLLTVFKKDAGNDSRNVHGQY